MRIYCRSVDHANVTLQVLATATVVGLVAHFASGLPGPAAIVIGNGLALSSTAVVLQVKFFCRLSFLYGPLVLVPN